MSRKHVTILLSAVSIVLLVLLTTTNPTHLPSILLILPFGLLFIILWCAAFLGLRTVRMTRLKSGRLAMVLAGLPVGILLLQSIGQLAIRDVLTILAFSTIAYFYIARLTTARTE